MEIQGGQFKKERKEEGEGRGILVGIIMRAFYVTLGGNFQFCRIEIVATVAS